jgi:hypothetical protein
VPAPCTRHHACRSSSGLFTEHRCTCQIKELRSIGGTYQHREE